MACEILMITEQEVKDMTDITENVDVSKFCHYIPGSQMKHIETIIGQSCYNLLLTQIENDNLSAANLTLLNGDSKNYPGIKKALAYWILWEAYPNLFSTITPLGVQTKSSENEAPVAPPVLATRMNQAKGFAEMYSDKIICYIKDNIDDYPCYNECGDCCEEKKGSGYGSSSGIAFDDDESCGCTDDDCTC